MENTMTELKLTQDQIIKICEIAKAQAHKPTQQVVGETLSKWQQQAEELKKQQQVIDALKNPPLSRPQLEKNIVERIKNRHSGSSHRYPEANSELEQVMWAIEDRSNCDSDRYIIDAVTMGPWGCDTDSAVMLEHEDMQLMNWIDDYKEMLVETEEA
jgi:hypothetical protein